MTVAKHTFKSTGSSNLCQQLRGFVPLCGRALSAHFLKDRAGALGIAELDIGLGEIELDVQFGRRVLVEADTVILRLECPGTSREPSDRSVVDAGGVDAGRMNALGPPNPKVSTTVAVSLGSEGLVSTT